MTADAPAARPNGAFWGDMHQGIYLRRPLSNQQIERLWIDAWNKLYELSENRWNTQCQLPDYSIVDVETCKGWIQDAVYDGRRVDLTDGWIQGRKGVIVSFADVGEPSK